VISALHREDLRKCLLALDAELAKDEVSGEVYLVGGAVMCLVFDARPSTADMDALFLPSAQIRRAAARVAARLGLQPSWLNDAVKGYLSAAGEFTIYLELDHLRVFTAQPAYLLAMKCLAMRLGEEYHDMDDVRYLLRALNIGTYAEAMEVLEKYYPIERFPQKTWYMLKELLG
jgi:hypothetical protein